MWEKILYRQFWDFPRLFVVAHQGVIYLFDCDFDDQLDDYPPTFNVYRLTNTTLEDFRWNDYLTGAIFLGNVEVRDVKFDITRRNEIDSEILGKFLRERR